MSFKVFGKMDGANPAIMWCGCEINIQLLSIQYDT